MYFQLIIISNPNITGLKTKLRRLLSLKQYYILSKYEWLVSKPWCELFT